jgi:hypothetical protein
MSQRLRLSQYLISSNYIVVVLHQLYHQRAKTEIRFISQTKIVLTKHMPTRESTANPVSVGTSLQNILRGVAGKICLSSEEYLLGKITTT